MGRGYSREAYLDLVDHVRTIVPGVSISSDFISGFCGETEEDHRETISLMEQVRYDQVGWPFGGNRLNLRKATSDTLTVLFFRVFFARAWRVSKSRGLSRGGSGGAGGALAEQNGSLGHACECWISSMLIGKGSGGGAIGRGGSRGWCRIGPGGVFEISRAGSGHPDSARPANSDPTPEKSCFLLFIL